MFIACVPSSFAMLQSGEPYVDPAIQGPERDLMLSVLEPLGSDFTGDAVYIDVNGVPHVNKLSLSVLTATPVPGTSDLQWPNGEQFTPPTELTQTSGPPAPSTDPYYDAGGEEASTFAGPTLLAAKVIPGPPVVTNSGPYRRVYLGPPGIDSVNVVGYLASDSGLHPANVPGTAYAYLSAWSVPASPLEQQIYHAACDFGLQFSHLRRVWDPFCVWGGKAYSVTRNIPSGWTFQMNMKKPYFKVISGVNTALIYSEQRETFGNSWSDTVWISGNSTTLQWDSSHFGVTKSISISQRPEGNTGSFHIGSGWSSTTVASNGTQYNWSQFAGGFSLQRYPTSLVAGTWTRLPVVTAGNSPDSEVVWVDARP